MNNIIKFRKGVTLVELIISIAIIGIITISFLPLFTMTAKTNSRSKDRLKSTYIGKDTMELIYSLSEKNIENNIKNNKEASYKASIKYLNENIEKDSKYEKIGEETVNVYKYKYNNDKYIKIKYKDKENLIAVVVEVYKDQSMETLQVKYESLYPWKKSGD